MIQRDIIERAKEKDEEAMEEIYLEFKDFVWNIALKTAGSRTAAEDAAAETFIRVFKKIGKFNFKSSFKTWLYRVTVNTTLNCMDKERRRKTLHLNEEYRDIQAEGSAPQDDGRDNEMVNKMLDKLEPKERIFVYLRDIQGTAYNEIADIMKMNIGTVKTNIYRAREKLRKIYKEEFPNEERM
ncbi:RNA polymerase sigma factor [Elusimicrobiota bacterium]